jgi:hypothetical protein
MAVRVIESRGRLAGLPGKGAPIYTVGKYGGMLIDDVPMGMVAYRSAAAVPLSVAPTTWAKVVLDTFVYPPSSYGLPDVQISNGGLLFSTPGQFLVTASIKFSPINGNSVVHHRYRLTALYSYGEYSAGHVTFAPNQYDWVMGGSGCIMDMPAGNGFILQVSHTYAGSLTLIGGLDSASISIGRLSG